MRRRLLFLRRDRRERGAVAVLMAVVLVGLLIPLTGFGVSTVINSGISSELQRAADQGALAGAASIPLADPSALQAFVVANQTQSIDAPDPTDPTQTILHADASITGPSSSTALLLPNGYCTAGVNCPLDIAVSTCQAELAKDNGFTGAFGRSTGVCTAKYLGDHDFFTNLTSCVLAAQSTAVSSLNKVPLTGAQLSSFIGAFLTPLTGSLIGRIPMQGYATLLPALLRPGIVVTASITKRGPFDNFNPGDNGLPHTEARTGAARRQFKNVVVVPTVGSSVSVTSTLSAGLGLGFLTASITDNVNVSTGATIDLNPALGQAAGAVPNPLRPLPTPSPGTTSQPVSTVFSNITSAYNSSLGSSGCTNLIPSLQDDLSGLVNPPVSGAPNAAQVISDAAADNSPIFGLVVPNDPLGALNVPFLDFVPMCLKQTGVGGTDLTKAQVLDPSTVTAVGSCSLAAPGAFRARLVG